MASKDQPRGQVPASSSNKKKKTKDCICPVCEDVIIEGNGKKCGDDAIYCDGHCDAWLHRRCAGLSTTAFKMVTTAPKCTPFSAHIVELIC